MLIIIYLKASFYSCVLRCLNSSTTAKTPSDHQWKWGQCRAWPSPISPSPVWRDQYSLAWHGQQQSCLGIPPGEQGMAPCTPIPFRRKYSQVVFSGRDQQEVHGPVLLWSLQVMSGLCKHLWWRCLSAFKVQWLILTPRVELGNLSLLLPSHSAETGLMPRCLESLGCCSS